jgi:hypothetical protein
MARLAALLVGLVALFAVSGGATNVVAASAPAVREVRFDIAVPDGDVYRYGSISMFALDEPGVDMEARIAEGKAAMLARFPGAFEVPAGGASAQFRIFGVRWPNASTSWSYNGEGATSSLSADAALAAVRAGANGWTGAGGAAWHFDYLGPTSVQTGCNGVPTALPADGLNVVGWGHIAGGFLGYSCWWRSGSFVPGTPYFAATEFDIVFEPAYAYAATTLQALAMHEFGHALGLDHAEKALCPGAAMCDGDQALIYSTPQKDDIFGIQAIYGPSAPPPPPVIPAGTRPYHITAAAVSRDSSP